MFLLLDPTETPIWPLGITQRCPAVSQMARSNRVSESVTVFVCPGVKNTESKPLRLFGGDLADAG